LVVVEVSIAGIRRWRWHRKSEKAIALQKNLHRLKQQEFELRYELAQKNGSLKAFEDKGPKA